jgi:DNA polymerase V
MPFPSPADDHAEKRLDITDLLIAHPASTYFMRVSGDAMIGDGIGDRDTVVIDRALTASDQAIIVARLGTRFTLRRLRIKDGRMWLQAANSAYSTIEVTKREDFEVWGVVTWVLHKIAWRLR